MIAHTIFTEITISYKFYLFASIKTFFTYHLYHNHKYITYFNNLNKVFNEDIKLIVLFFIFYLKDDDVVFLLFFYMGSSVKR
jgi:hypothetical protein